MRHDDGTKSPGPCERLETRHAEVHEEGHVVFDFSGVGRAGVGDLALILTARLGTDPDEKVWIRSVPGRTAQALRVLRLEHLFLRYPEADGEMN